MNSPGGSVGVANVLLPRVGVHHEGSTESPGLLGASGAGVGTETVLGDAVDSLNEVDLCSRGQQEVRGG